MNNCSIPSHNRPLKIYANLARTVMALDATKCGVMRQYRWWTVLRNSKPDGVEWFTSEEVKAAFNASGMSRTQYNNLVTVAKNGSVFFRLADDGRIFLTSLQNVCTAFPCVPGDVVLIPSASVAGPIHRFKAAIHAAQNAYKPRMASRKTLQDELGISPSTQRRYEAHSGLSVIANYCKANRYDADGLPVESLPIPDGAYCWLDDNGRSVVWQGPNLYTADRELLKIELKPTRRGLARKVAKRIRSGFDDNGEVERRERFFYDGATNRRGKQRVIKHSHAILQRDANGTPLTYCRPSTDGHFTAERLYVYRVVCS